MGTSMGMPGSIEGVAFAHFESFKLKEWLEWSVTTIM